MRTYNKKRISYAILISIIITIMVSLPVANAQTENETFYWEKYLRKVQRMENDVDKIEVYEKFLKKFPDNFYVPEATKSITKIKLQIIAPEDFEAAIKENTFESYRAFIEKHKEGELVKKAQVLAIDKFLTGKSFSDIIKLFKDNGIGGEYKEYPAGETIRPPESGSTIRLSYDIGIYYGNEHISRSRPEYVILITADTDATFNAMYSIANKIIPTYFKSSSRTTNFALSLPYTMSMEVVMPDSTNSISFEYDENGCVNNFPNQSWANFTYIGSAKAERFGTRPDNFRNDFFLRCDPYKILAISVREEAPEEKIGNNMKTAFYSIFNLTDR